MKKTKNNDFFHKKDLCGVTVMGVRGQVVISKKIREKLKIKSGDNFLVMEKNGAIIFIPTQQVKKMMSFISKELNKIN